MTRDVVTEPYDPSPVGLIPSAKSRRLLLSSTNDLAASRTTAAVDPSDPPSGCTKTAKDRYGLSELDFRGVDDDAN